MTDSPERPRLIDEGGTPVSPEVQAAFDQNNPFERSSIIGMLVERFATLEYTVRHVTRGLIHDPIAAQTLTVRATVGQNLDLAQSILAECERLGESRAPAGLADALKRVRPVLEKRNNLFHNVHLPGEAAWEMTVWKYKRGEDRPQIIPMNTADLIRMDREVNEVMGDIMNNRPR